MQPALVGLSHPLIGVATATNGCMTGRSPRCSTRLNRDELEEIDGALHRAVRCLRDGIASDALGKCHDEHGGPLIVYAENLVYSTLDYGYIERDLPALVGFDVLPYAAVDSMTPPGNPYAETFEGFLTIEAAWRVFDRIRIEDTSRDQAFVPATILAETSEFDPDNYAVPQSSLADDVRAEGVVIRSDSRDRRVKVVREAFEGLNREQFGRDPDDVETGAERIVAMYCTSARIRKTVRSLVVEEDREFGVHLVENLYPRVVEDIWAEHWEEIMRLDFEFTASTSAERTVRRSFDTTTLTNGRRATNATLRRKSKQSSSRDCCPCTTDSYAKPKSSHRCRGTGRCRTPSGGCTHANTQSHSRRPRTAPPTHPRADQGGRSG